MDEYVALTRLERNRRPKLFSSFSSADKASLVRLHLALQFAKRQNLNEIQRDIILDGILLTSSEMYEKDVVGKTSSAKQSAAFFETRVKASFSNSDAAGIFAEIGGIEPDIPALLRYQSLFNQIYESERRATFQAMNGSEKSDTVRTHLAVQLAQRSLNKEKGELIVEAIHLANSSIYNIRRDSDEWNNIHQTLNSLKDRLLVHFQKEEAVEIFATLGGEKKDPADNGENLAPNCSCSGNSDYCDWWRSGSSCSSSSCRFQVGGCGTLLMYDCDGLCTGGVV